MTLAQEVAAEHIAWAATEGKTQSEMLAAIGIRWISNPTWGDVERAYECAWLNLSAKSEMSAPGRMPG